VNSRQEYWERHYAERMTHRHSGVHVSLESRLEPLVPGAALDLACGAGANAIWLARRGWHVTAVDFSPTAIGLARELAASDGVEVDWIVADLLAYEPRPRSFALVLLSFLQLPADERELVLGRAVAAVAPGGTFLLAAHDPSNLIEGIHGPRDPEVLYAATDVVPYLSGFQIEEAERLRRTVATPNGNGVMVDAIVRARRPADS
jgi:SAM-dependent methyltransferase